VCHNRVRLQRKRPSQQAVPGCGSQVRERLMSAGASKEQHAKSFRAGISRRKRRELTWRAESSATRGCQRQRVTMAWLKICRVELPKLALRVGHPAGNGPRPDLQIRR